MMHEKAIEAAARAACESQGLNWEAQANFLTSGGGSDEEQDGYREMARAAILAFLEAIEPSEAMKQKCGEAYIAAYHHDPFHAVVKAMSTALRKEMEAK